ncbi:MAG: glutamate mutase L [Pseudonocardia sp.]|nr:glutamate mutase L [Pseudonocardia sp.]
MTDPRPGDPTAPAVCLDVGSCWTKAALVHPDGSLAGYAEHPTTAEDVLAGVDAAVAGAAASSGRPGAPAPDVLACSSAGGSLRLAVVGVERLAAVEAAHQVCRSSGARVVHVHAGPLEGGAVRELRSNRPGVVLLVGGSDGDDPEVLLHNASRLARARGRYPVVLAGNAEARDDALGLLRSTGRTVTACPNVAPRPGEIAPDAARAAVAELYSNHVLGLGAGPGGPRFRRLVRTRTPVAVGDGVVALARAAGTGVIVVDVGSATTDVHSAGPHDTLAPATVEGDLGVRSSAAGVLLEAQTEGVVDPVEADLLAPSVAALAASGPSAPADRGSAAEDRRLAALASVVALRRHLRGRDGEPGPGAGEIGLVVLTGGVFRQRDAAGLVALAETVRRDPVLMGPLAQVAVRVDSGSVLAPAGLLASHGRAPAAETLLRDHLLD